VISYVGFWEFLVWLARFPQRLDSSLRWPFCIILLFLFTFLSRVIISLFSQGGCFQPNFWRDSHRDWAAHFVVWLVLLSSLRLFFPRWHIIIHSSQGLGKYLAFWHDSHRDWTAYFVGNSVIVLLVFRLFLFPVMLMTYLQGGCWHPKYWHHSDWNWKAPFVDWLVPGKHPAFWRDSHRDWRAFFVDHSVTLLLVFRLFLSRWYWRLICREANNNQLAGTIPTQIGQLISLSYLYHSSLLLLLHFFQVMNWKWFSQDLE